MKSSSKVNPWRKEKLKPEDTQDEVGCREKLTEDAFVARSRHDVSHEIVTTCR